MIVYLIRFLKKSIFPFFLISFVISFFIPSLYKEIVDLEFGIIAPLVVVLNYQSKSILQSIQLIFIVFTICTVVIGVPGSALGYLLSAASGLFVSQQLLISKDQRGFILEYRLFAFTAVIFIAASFFLLYTNFINTFSIEQIADYFGVASINYASLTIASFCSIYSVWCARRYFNESIITTKQNKILRIISCFLGIIMLVLCIIFSTRSAILGCVPPFLFAFQPKRPYRYLFVFVVIAVGLYFAFPAVAESIISLMAPGRESIFDLYESELKGQERSAAAFAIFEKGIPKFSFCLDCSEYLSYSGISNLVALSFPFSIFYIIQIIRFIIGYSVKMLYPTKKNRLLILIVLVSFINSLLLTTFQADFLSMVSLFYVVGNGLFLIRK